jgi:hypothetical protein
MHTGLDYYASGQLSLSAVTKARTDFRAKPYEERRCDATLKNFRSFKILHDDPSQARMQLAISEASAPSLPCAVLGMQVSVSFTTRNIRPYRLLVDSNFSAHAG